MKSSLKLFAFSVLVAAFTGCKKEYMSADEYQSLNSDHNVSLGRALFYDQKLSINNSVSCASCHKQELAFADNVEFSTGFNGQLTTRNTPGIQNLDGGFIPLFWDGRQTNLNEMVLEPIMNHIEMGFDDMDQVRAKLEATNYYPALFKKEFGSHEITREKIGIALAGFVSSIRTNQSSPFGQGLFDMSELTELEREGFFLFESIYRCNDCHGVDRNLGYLNNPSNGFSNIGLDKTSKDPGLGGFTGNGADIGRFKIPSLKNVALTAPYMHDGRFKTLREVLDHYSDEIEEDPNLDPLLIDPKTHKPKVMDIKDHEKDAIIAFLESLTDQEMITNPAFSDPYK